MSRKRQGSDDNGHGDPVDATLADRAFDLKRRHEKRILSWSPDPDEELTPAAVAAPAEPYVPEAAPVAPPTPARVAEAPVAPAPRPVRAPAEPPPAAEAAEEEKPRRRGRPKGRAQRRQVHFHVNPEEDRLLLTAAARYGSQQKGLIAALRSLQEVELLRDEIRRLQAEFERQQQLLEEAEALFRR